MVRGTIRYSNFPSDHAQIEHSPPSQRTALCNSKVDLGHTGYSFTSLRSRHTANCRYRADRCCKPSSPNAIHHKVPQTVQNVVTYTIVISAENQDRKLLPGMTPLCRW